MSATNQATQPTPPPLPPLPAGSFTSPVTAHGFAHVDEAAADIPDHVHLGRLPAVTVALADITVASQPTLNPELVRHYAEHPPPRKRVLLRPYGDGQDDAIACADGHHAIAGARLRGDTAIRARWMAG